MGFPMRLCEGADCNSIYGFWARLPIWFPIGDEDGEFCFMEYEGSYLKALWNWMFNPA